MINASNLEEVDDFFDKVPVEIVLVVLGMITSSFTYMFTKWNESKNKKRNLKELNYMKFIDSLSEIKKDPKKIDDLAAAINYITLVGSPELVKNIYKYQVAISGGSNDDNVSDVSGSSNDDNVSDVSGSSENINNKDLQIEIYTKIINLMRKELKIDSCLKKLDTKVYPIIGQ